MSCSWILLEVVARAARSGSSSSWSNFITSLQLLRDNQSWLDPTDSYNDCVKVLNEEERTLLRAYSEETLRIWQTRVVQVQRSDVCKVIGKHGLALQSLEDHTGAAFLISKVNNAMTSIEVFACPVIDLNDVCHLVQAVSQGKLLPNRWHSIESTAEASDSVV